MKHIEPLWSEDGVGGSVQVGVRQVEEEGEGSVEQAHDKCRYMWLGWGKWGLKGEEVDCELGEVVVEGLEGSGNHSNGSCLQVEVGRVAVVFVVVVGEPLVWTMVVMVVVEGDGRVDPDAPETLEYGVSREMMMIDGDLYDRTLAVVSDLYFDL